MLPRQEGSHTWYTNSICWVADRKGHMDPPPVIQLLDGLASCSYIATELERTSSKLVIQSPRKFERISCAWYRTTIWLVVIMDTRGLHYRPPQEHALRIINVRLWVLVTDRRACPLLIKATESSNVVRLVGVLKGTHSLRCYHHHPGAMIIVMTISR